MTGIMYLWSALSQQLQKPVASPSNTTLPKFSEAGVLSAAKVHVTFFVQSSSRLYIGIRDFYTGNIDDRTIIHLFESKFHTGQHVVECEINCSILCS